MIKKYFLELKSIIQLKTKQSHTHTNTIIHKESRNLDRSSRRCRWEMPASVAEKRDQMGCLLSWQHILDHVLSIYSKKVVDTFMRVTGSNTAIGDGADRTVPSGSRDKMCIL